MDPSRSSHRNLNSHFEFPVIHKPGRGLPFDYILSFDNSVWAPVLVSGVLTWQPAPNWGWRSITQAATGYISYRNNRTTCIDPDTGIHFTAFYQDNYQYLDMFGTVHDFSSISGGCPGDNTGADTVSTDAS